MKRLSVVCSMIEKTGVFADIGCDHGYVAKFVCDQGLADRIYATDVSEGSLKKAAELLGGDPRVSILQGDGFAPLVERGVSVDTAVICGMGGRTIMKILDGPLSVRTLILGAQKNAPMLRSYLIERGYRLIRDTVVEDRGKYYDVIKAEPGADGLDGIQLRFGKFYKEKNEDLLSYLYWLTARLAQYKQTDENVRLSEMATEVLRWQR